MRTRLILWLVLWLICLCGPLTAETRISVSPDERLPLEVPSIQVSGAVAGGKVIIDASLTDLGERVWSSRGTYYADHEGRVDPAVLASVDGTYMGVDAFGLFWSMVPAPDTESVPSAPLLGESVEVTLTARVETRADSLDTTEISTSHQVRLVRDGVTRHEVREGDLRGVLFRPPEPSSFTPVLVISGSGGGAPESAAQALANEGLTALAIAHFNYPDRPAELLEIPLEYFEEAIEYLKGETGSEKVALMGSSRGGEGVLIIASTFPEQVSAVVSGVPSNIVNSACCSPAMTYEYAWTYQGRPLPAFGLVEGTGFKELLGVNQKYADGFEWFQRHMLIGKLTEDRNAPYIIPVERIEAPILLISGDADAVWPSSPAADRVVRRLEENGYAYRFEHIKVTGAGHTASVAERLLVTSQIGSAPFRHRLDPTVEFTMGGAPAENFHGPRAAHYRKIEFLKQVD